MKIVEWLKVVVDIETGESGKNEAMKAVNGVECVKCSDKRMGKVLHDSLWTLWETALHPSFVLLSFMINPQLQKRNESMRKKLEADLSELEEERERFERERKAWEAANGVTVEELRRKSLESISREWVPGVSLCHIVGCLFH